MNVHFGFSYIGLIFLVMLMTPNMVWTKNKPKDYDTYVKNENKILLAFERMGEILVTCISFIFTDFNINNISGWSIILLFAFILMILYEIYWIRYFKSKKTMKDFYSSSGSRGNFAGIGIFITGHIWKKYISDYCNDSLGNRTYWNTHKP